MALGFALAFALALGFALALAFTLTFALAFGFTLALAFTFHLASQFGRVIGQLALAARKIVGISVAAGLALERCLLVDHLLDAANLLLDPSLLVFQSFAAFFAQQQFEQPREIAFHLGLARNGHCQPVFLQERNQLLELQADQVVLALGHGLAQQRRAFGIRRRRQLGHPQDDLLESAILGRNLLLVDGKFGRRSGFILRAVPVRCVSPVATRLGIRVGT